MVSRSRIWGTRRKVSSRLEGPLKVRWRRKVSRVVHIRRAGRSEFQVLGAAALKLQVPDEVRTNGAESRLVFDKLIALIEWWWCKAGWEEWRVQNMILAILKLMWYSAGNHWSCWRRVCELRWKELVTTRARRFCTFCSMEMFSLVEPYKTVLA